MAPPAPRGTIAVADTGRVDLSAVPEALRSCIPEADINHAPTRDERVTFYVVGSAGASDGSETVLLTHFGEDPGGVALFNPVVLNVEADGTCAAVPDARSQARALLAATPDLRRRDAEIRIEVAGGPEAFANASARPGRSGRWFRECATSESTQARGCLASETASLYRELGVPVLPSPDDGADLTAVPDSLHACIPEGFRNQPLEFHSIGAAPTVDGTTPVLLEYFDTSSPVVVQPVALYVSDTGCVAGSVWASDVGIEEAFELLETPALADISARLHVARAGGPDAYVELYDALRGGLPLVCGPGERPVDDGCFSAVEAAAYRDQGVAVR